MSAVKLPYLIEEICAAVEIYYTGRSGGQYLKTSFILCDDYTELTAKLFLLTDSTTWSDKKADGHFKNYHAVLGDVDGVLTPRLADPIEVTFLRDIHARMKDRRDRRNDFFHSTHLLDLSIAQRGVVEAFCDLFTYGELLFRDDWRRNIISSRNLDTMRILLRLEKENLGRPTIWGQAMEIIRDFPRNKSNAARKGVHLTEYPEDLHLRLCITHGSNILRDQLKALLPGP